MGYFSAFIAPALKGFSDRELEGRSELSRETIRKTRHGYLPTLDSAIELIRVLGLDVQEGVLRLEMDRLREAGLSPVLMLPLAQRGEQRLLVPLEAFVAAGVMNEPEPIQTLDDLKRRGQVNIGRDENNGETGFAYARGGRITLSLGDTPPERQLQRALEVYLVARFQPGPPDVFVAFESAPPELIYESTLFAIYVLYPLPTTGHEVAAFIERGIDESLRTNIQRRKLSSVEASAVIHAYDLLRQAGLLQQYAAQYRQRVEAYLLPPKGRPQDASMP